MTSVTLLAGVGYASAGALLFAYVGWQLLRRPVAAVSQPAAALYASWWLAIAATSLMEAIGNGFAAAGVLDLRLFLALNYVKLLAICIGLWGLLYYVVYLRWGSGLTLPVLAVFYAANFLLFVVHVSWAQPTAVHVGRWRTGLVYDGPWAPALAAAWGVLVFFPLLLAIIAYFTVYFEIRDPTARYRVVAVAVAILVWLESRLLTSIPSLADQDAWQVAAHLAAVASACAVLLAYHPPGWIAHRFGVRDLEPMPMAAAH
jgi:hypothetical protein